MLPLYHTFGISSIFDNMVRGLRFILVPHFTFKNMLEAIQEHKVTVLARSQKYLGIEITFQDFKISRFPSCLSFQPSLPNLLSNLLRNITICLPCGYFFPVPLLSAKKSKLDWWKNSDASSSKVSKYFYF